MAKTGAHGAATRVRQPAHLRGRKHIVEFGNTGIAVRSPLLPERLDAAEAATKAAGAP